MPLETLRKYLRPLSWLYGAAVGLRNLLYDRGVLKSREFPLPVISVGNLTVGGTGKTPHVEYLLHLLRGTVSVAVVSRGYRRKTRGLVMATPASTAAQIGDEPLQMLRHFPGLRLAADADRCEAVARLMQADILPPVGAVVLDDAYQHRRIRPGMNILLTDFPRPIFADRLLPAGNLREGFAQRRRADAVIVSKCPGTLTRRGAARFAERLNLFPRQRLFFTQMKYGEPYGLLSNQPAPLPRIAETYGFVMAVAGVARPLPFFDEIRKFAPGAECVAFGDHHDFTAADIRAMEDFIAIKPGGAVVTTEKDAARLLGHAGEMSVALRENTYVLPIRVEFLFDGQNEFNDLILEYVGEYRKDGRVPRAAN